MKTQLWLVLALAGLLSGCSASPKANVRHIDWQQRLGTYTYDQALTELGRPQVVGESTDGKTAEWILRRRTGLSFGFGVGTGTYGRHTGVGVGAGTTITPPPRGEYLRLKFDKEGKLREWSKVRY